MDKVTMIALMAASVFPEVARNTAGSDVDRLAEASVRVAETIWNTVLQLRRA
jgi:hypothetical protein